MGSVAAMRRPVVKERTWGGYIRVLPDENLKEIREAENQHMYVPPPLSVEALVTPWIH